MFAVFIDEPKILDGILSTKAKLFFSPHPQVTGQIHMNLSATCVPLFGSYYFHFKSECNISCKVCGFICYIFSIYLNRVNCTGPPLNYHFLALNPQVS